jgi:hypothetical protein
MGTGYTRNDASNNIANGNVIDAADLDGEFDAIESAFGTSGHSHDGTSAEGGAITLIGPSQEFRGDGSSFYPKSDATYDLGKSTASFDVAYVESINLAGTGITASAAEINYTDGVTSAIQTQLDGKQAADSNIVSDANYVRTDQNFTNADHTKLNGIATGATNTATPAITSDGSTPSLSSGISAAEVRSLIGAGTSSSDNATHTGEVTGSGSLTIAADVVDAGNLKVTGNGTTSQFLRSDGDGTFTWATPTDTNTTYSVGDGGLTQKNFTSTLKTKLDGIATGATANVGDITGVTAGSGISGGGTSGTVTISHSDTSSQASVNNSGRTYIQDITLDTYGHITGITSATETVTNTNTTYSAGSGLDLSGTTFSIESDLRDNVQYVGRDGNDYMHIGTSVFDWYINGNHEMRLESDGDLHVDGNIVGYSTTVSDERLKTDIVKIDNALDKVSQLGGYTFEYIEDGKKSAGVIAQEVEKVLPSAITESTLPLKMGEDNDTSYKTVQYDQLTGLLIEAIKELKAEIEVLKGN